jgi:hypothetical protein
MLFDERSIENLTLFVKPQPRDIVEWRNGLKVYDTCQNQYAVTLGINCIIGFVLLTVEQSEIRRALYLT